jgi:hypothetical protein
MSHTLTEVSTYTSSVTVPDPGDARTAASVEVGFQALSNRTRYIKDTLDLAVEGWKPDADIAVPLTMLVATNFSFLLGQGPGANAAGCNQSTTSASFMLPLPVRMGNGTLKLKSVSISYRPSNGHGALPASQPILQVFRQGYSAASALTQLGSNAQDNAANVVAYEALRTLTVSGLNHTLTTSDSYYLSFIGESGANSQTGLLVTGARMIISLT